MTIALQWEWGVDGWIVAVAILCAVACSLLGNFLVLRRMSMLGDAISHAVLPGLVVAFLVSNSRSSLPMFMGAVVVGVLTAFFTEWIRRTGNVDEGASMGVVFTSLFAVGLVMIVQAADHVDLDASCVLFGAIEWTYVDKLGIAGFEIPRAAVVLFVVLLINLLFVILCFKELQLASFDPALATTTGFNATAIHYALMVLVAVTAVASFESVGSVLVVAMLIVPPAAAYMLTDRLSVMIGISVVVAVAAAVLGHLGALVVPSWFGYDNGTNTAGMMAVAAGGLLTLAVMFGPRHGILVKFVRQQLLSMSILADDVVAVLYRIGEQKEQPASSLPDLRELLFCKRAPLAGVLAWLDRRGDVVREGDLITLTNQGRDRAQNLVRSHRLWEHYLQDQAGVDVRRVHVQAEKMEHFTDEQLRRRLDRETDAPQVDPHGRPIPDEPA